MRQLGRRRRLWFVDLAMPIAIGPRVHSFSPKYPLWADGAVKAATSTSPSARPSTTVTWITGSSRSARVSGRRLRLAATRVETRLMHRFGPGEGDWVFAAYQWIQTSHRSVGCKARLRCRATCRGGVVNANGTTHDIPPYGACTNCHTKLIGVTSSVFGAFQLSHAPWATARDLRRSANLGWLTMPHPTASTSRVRQCSKLPSVTCTVTAAVVNNQSQSIPTPRILCTCDSWLERRPMRPLIR